MRPARNDRDGNPAPGRADRDAEGARPHPRANARERILEAAAAVAHDVGPGRLSLDAVADRAGVSKGGLLYHFPTKQALITALIERHLSAIEEAAGITEDGPAPDGNAVALGLLSSYCATAPKKPGGAEGFFAAMAEAPTLLDPIREHNLRVAACLRRSRAPEAALIAFFVVEGMRSLEFFDANPLSRAECQHLLATLQGALERDAKARSDRPA
jgi:AcrR family transcriptional regulator